MDESRLHDLLELAVGDPPPTSVNITLARTQGRRRLRWRHIYVPIAAAVTMAAAAALVVTVAPFGLVSGHALAGRKVEHQSNPAFVAHPPTRFNLAIPYASFGWLPTGFSASNVPPGIGGAGVGGAQSAQSETLGAPSNQADVKALSLQVNTFGACRLTSAEALRNVRLRHSKHPPALDCGTGVWQLTSGAPEINGGPAFWDQRGDLFWEYGREAWAELQPLVLRISPVRDPHFDGWFNVPARPRSAISNGHPAIRQSAATRALLLKVAAAVHYGDTTVQVYGFTLSGVPAGWRSAASPVSFQAMGGLVANTSWQLGPASDQSALGVSVAPAQDGYPCPFTPGQSQHVTVDGVQANLRTIDRPYKHWQSLCVNDIDGLQLWIELDLNIPGTNNTPLPGSAEFGSALAVFGRLRLLGPNPVRWTPNPLR